MAEEIIFRDDVTVELVKASASDADVIWAARVSTAGEQSMEEIGEDPVRSAGLINYLARERHGSPFEHTSMTFFISAPIFVFREFMRHRIASYNEEKIASLCKLVKLVHTHLKMELKSNLKLQLTL
jgi:thymidylate synthase (FAD)